MFKIVLQPEERAMLLLIKDGLFSPGRVPDAMVQRLTALRMLVCDERGNPKVTPLGEAALARMARAIQ